MQCRQLYTFYNVNPKFEHPVYFANIMKMKISADGNQDIHRIPLEISGHSLKFFSNTLDIL